MTRSCRSWAEVDTEVRPIQAAWLGGELGGEWIHVYVWLSPFAAYLKLAQHC